MKFNIDKDSHVLINIIDSKKITQKQTIEQYQELLKYEIIKERKNSKRKVLIIKKDKDVRLVSVIKANEKMEEIFFYHIPEEGIEYEWNLVEEKMEKEKEKGW